MPENIRDRDEILLNAIATGDTTGIEPRDREEKFIIAIAQNTGSVRKVDGSLTITASTPTNYSLLLYEADTSISLNTDAGIKEFLSTFDFGGLYYGTFTVDSDSTSAIGPIISVTSTGSDISIFQAGTGHLTVTKITPTGMEITPYQ